jgi:hypothetical protein
MNPTKRTKDALLDQALLDAAQRLIEREEKRKSAQRTRKQLQDMLRDAPEGSTVKTILEQRLKKAKN